MLNWDLVIATYKREEILQQCIRLAVEQTRPPAQIIIVDASPNWALAREALLKQLAEQKCTIPVQYVGAQRASIPVQRNQGIRLSTAPIVFLLDDDSLMYPDCAEQVMRVYETDQAGEVVGVGPVNHEEPPESVRHLVPPPITSIDHHANWRQRASSWVTRMSWRGWGYFLPYDSAFPHRQTPASCRGLAVQPAALFEGYRMTFRRQTFEQLQFDEMLDRYAVSEDQDFSYRASRNGILLNALDARLCHLTAGGGRLSPRTTALLQVTNRLALNAVNSNLRNRTCRRYLRSVPYHFATGMARDFLEGNWNFPQARGVIGAVPYCLNLLRMSAESIRACYPKIQAEVIAHDDRKKANLKHGLA